jgi:hypothetical protein
MDAKETFGHVMKPQALKEITREVNTLEEDSIKKNKPRPGVDLWGGDDLDIEEIELVES